MAHLPLRFLLAAGKSQDEFQNLLRLFDGG